LSGDSSYYFGDIKKYIIEQYKQNIFDEFIVPAINKQLINDVKLENNDSVIFANFRPDRARQISHLIFGSNYYDYKPNIKKQNLYFVTMMSYEGIAPSSIAYPPIKLKNVFGKVLENNNIKQLRISETEKYAHVTFFFDGGEEIDYKKETKIIIPSPKVATYDLQPEMSANLICDELLKQMNSNDVIIVNFANGDMVGHTGKLEPTIKAIECVDKQIGKIYELSKKLNFTLFITADHGNADMVIDDKNNPVTSHTLNPVPFIITSDKYKIIKTIGKLCDIVPTILYHMNIDKPDEMTGNNLIINKK
jgi:2,3-bisphosphoglycerate-independent phosphoglycerate mutase